VGLDEVLKEAALARARRLIPELVIPDLGEVYELRDLLRDEVTIELLKRPLVGLHGSRSSPP
jgi:hypothetical protein